MSHGRPKLVCFTCSFGWGYLSDNPGLGAQIPNRISVACTGQIDSTHIFTALKKGADGILILACPVEECHFQEGNIRAAKQFHLMQNVLEAYGIEPQRIRLEMSSDPEGGTIPGLVNEMEETLMKLGHL